MKNSIFDQLKKTYSLEGDDGVIQTPINGIRLFWATTPITQIPLLYDRGLVLIKHGQKIGYLNGEKFTYDPHHYLIVNAPVPFECTIIATPQYPLLGLFVDLDMTYLHEITALAPQEVKTKATKNEEQLHKSLHGVPMDKNMAETIDKLFNTLLNPAEIGLLGPLVAKELLCRALLGAQGHILYNMAQLNTPYGLISKAIIHIHDYYKDPITIPSLADSASMSISIFYKRFKEITRSTPLQYLKKVRLFKAKYLLQYEAVPVGTVCQQVGYNQHRAFQP